MCKVIDAELTLWHILLQHSHYSLHQVTSLTLQVSYVAEYLSC